MKKQSRLDVRKFSFSHRTINVPRYVIHYQRSVYMLVMLICSIIPDVPRRLALSNFEHLVSLSSEHRTHRQTDIQLKTLYGSLSKL